MTEQTNERAIIGGNKPPTPVEEFTEQYDGLLIEIANWCDGEPIKDDAGEAIIDDLAKQLRSMNAAAAKAKAEHTKPLHTEWKNAVAMWTPTIDDIGLQQKTLAGLVGPYKKIKADRIEVDRIAAHQEAQRVAAAAQEAAQAALENVGDIDAQREAAQAQKEAQAAKVSASKAQRVKVKGQRTVHHHEIQDHKALINWIAVNDKPALAEFMAEYARKNHQSIPGEVVKSWITKEAY